MVTAVLGLALPGPAFAAAPCAFDAATLEAGQSSSRWRESSEDGHTLVRESGRLDALAAGLRGACQGLRWRLRASGEEGARRYDGRSTTGAALLSTSAIRGLSVEAQLLWPLATSAGSDTWAAGASLGWRRLGRRLADAGAVRGYDERFTDVPLTADVSWQREPLAGLHLAAEVRLGAVMRPRMRLALPDIDAATLTLGRAWIAQIGVGADGALAGGRWQLRLQAAAEASGQGPSQALYRNGVPVAAALQPRTSRQSWTWFAGWSFPLR